MVMMMVMIDDYDDYDGGDDYMMIMAERQGKT